MYYLRSNSHQNSHLQNSWNKYGEDSFKFYVLEFCDCNELDRREIFYIDFYNSIDGNYGYNFKTGGQNGGSRYSEESRKKMSEAQKRLCANLGYIENLRNAALERWKNEEYRKSVTGENHPFFGKHLPEETRKKLSEKAKGKKKPKRSKEHCEALSKAHKGKMAHNRDRTPVRCVETGKIFCDATTAGKEMGFKCPESVITVCKGRRKTTHGYHFEFVNNEEI